MKKTALIFYLSLFYYACYCQTPDNDRNWDLNTPIFEEHFTGTSLNTSIWEASFGTYNNGFDWDPKNVIVNNGLTLKSTSGNTTGKPIHLGAVITWNPIGCGYYEIRCKVATLGPGYNTAFWNAARSTDYQCPNGWYKEIDFFEMLCDPNNFDVSSNAHYFINSCTDNNGEDFFSHYIRNDAYNQYHTYGYEWTPGRVIFYFDGQPYRILNSSFIDTTPLRLWINIGGSPNPAIDNFPGYFYVDYVKVYNLKRNCVNETISNFNSATYTNYSVKNTISINGTSQVISGNSVTLRAQNGITINGDFTVQQGGELTLLPTNCY